MWRYSFVSAALPDGVIEQMDIVNSGLEVLNDDDFAQTRVEYLRLMSNKIRRVSEKTFRQVTSFKICLHVSLTRKTTYFTWQRSTNFLISFYLFIGFEILFWTFFLYFFKDTITYQRNAKVEQRICCTSVIQI